MSKSNNGRMPGQSRKSAPVHRRAPGQTGVKQARQSAVLHPRVSGSSSVTTFTVNREYIVAIASGDNPFWKTKLPATGFTLEQLELGSVDSSQETQIIGGITMVKFSLDNLVSMSRYSQGGKTMYSDAFCSNFSAKLGMTGPNSDRAGTVALAAFPSGLHEPDVLAPDNNGGLNWIANCQNGRVSVGGTSLTSGHSITKHDAAFMWQPLGTTRSSDMTEFNLGICYYNMAISKADIAKIVLPPNGCFTLTIRATLHLKGFAQRTLNSRPTHQIIEPIVYVESPDDNKNGFGVLLRRSTYNELWAQRRVNGVHTISDVVRSICSGDGYDSGFTIMDHA